MISFSMYASIYQFLSCFWFLYWFQLMFNSQFFGKIISAVPFDTQTLGFIYVFLHSLLILQFSIGTSFDFLHLMWCILDTIQMRLMVERCQSEKIILHPKLIYANARNCDVAICSIFSITISCAIYKISKILKDVM